jgi:N-acetylneuraminate synthase/N,N'-diacetyllegionaminate synthase
MAPAPFAIAGRPLGPGHPCYLIAEAGVNHNGDLDLALRLVDLAAEAGADAVKFQTFRAAELATAEAPKAAYQAERTGAGESQRAMLERLELSPDAHRALIARATERGIRFLSTPFERESADLLERLDLPAFKLPSGELTNLPFLAHVARKGRPLILSTGMATLGEVEAALLAIRAAGDPPVAVLHCVSAYPAPAAQANLRAMETLAKAFGGIVGYSDHTEGLEVPLAAVAMGASIVEKHFTLDRSLPGPDHAASLEPEQLKALVRGIRIVESAFGDGRKAPTELERETARVARKSLAAALDLPAGTVLEAHHLSAKRPGTGLSPALESLLLGRTLRHAIPRDALLSLGDVE